MTSLPSAEILSLKYHGIKGKSRPPWYQTNWKVRFRIMTRSWNQREVKREARTTGQPLNIGSIRWDRGSGSPFSQCRTICTQSANYTCLHVISKGLRPTIFWKLHISQELCRWLTCWLLKGYHKSPLPTLHPTILTLKRFQWCQSEGLVSEVIAI